MGHQPEGISHIEGWVMRLQTWRQSRKWYHAPINRAPLGGIALLANLRQCYRINELGKESL